MSTFVTSGTYVEQLSPTDFKLSNINAVFKYTTVFFTFGSPLFTTFSAELNLNLIASIVPEPSILVLMGAGIFGLAAYRRFRTR